MTDFDPPKLSSQSGSVVEDDTAFTFETVQARLVEAVRCWWRMPDRESGWHAVRAYWPEIQRMGWRVAVGGEHDEREADPQPRRPRLTRDEVGEMEAVTEWLLLVPKEDRRVVVLALLWLAKGEKRVPWTRMLEQLGLARGGGALARRYERAIGVLALRLSGVSEARARAMVRGRLR